MKKGKIKSNKHLANVNKENQIHFVNLQNNFKLDLRIITPMEMIDYENENF